ncbi:MAG: isoleucine--tRNA ligase [Planctomycetaceae bacterium]|nr:MAG: isoleucine--tRNA ligase [Planctomycetaceae bacterium]
MTSTVSAFRAADSQPNFPQMEEQVLRFWDESDVYRRSLERRADAPSFVFYEGPPTANGMPHPGHCLTRSIKDVFPRYKTMRGFRCVRKAGWDTHGLPVEVEVGKELGLHSKEEIERYGIEAFIQKCERSVWRYMQAWRTLTRRLGFWVDLDEAYVTYHQAYVESVWWCLKNLFDRGLLYQGHKIVWWWAQGGTALSAGEVGEGYRDVADPSVYVRFRLVDQPQRSLVVWTTTPWTLPSNQFVAVHPELTYQVVRDTESNEELVLADALVDVVAHKAKRQFERIETVSGERLLGLRYTPPFDTFAAHAGETGRLRDGGSQARYFRIVAADFVTTESGTGLVHMAPAFGEADHEVLASERERFAEGQPLELFCAVGPDGKFTHSVPEHAGVWVKDADRPLIRQLKEAGQLLHQEQYVHPYPFCWRADQDPLIQYPRKSWFIRTTRFREAMLANNAQIGWQPEHIRDGRFGNFLAANVDWALSRERFWGTPLPIWVCQQSGRAEAIASYDELLSKPGVTGTEAWLEAKRVNPELVDDLRVHKPYIDSVTYDSPFAAGARMQRVSEVIDCWFDSGAMPFAQFGWPHHNDELFRDQFPADFISEAIDQTRGWFYSLLAISTMLFSDESAADGEAQNVSIAGPHPFRNCIVLGLMLGEDGQKMSKQKRNYREPTEIFEKYGADALRWFFFSGQPPWTAIRYREQSIRESIPEFLLRLYNVFSFFTIYAEIDGFDPAEGTRPGEQLDSADFASAAGYRPASDRSEIDRWILSELHQTIRTVTQRMDLLDNFGAASAITSLVDGLSNWYVRRSRDRFWAADKLAVDKLDAFWTLYEVLVSVSKLIAPFTPFLAESLWQKLREPLAHPATGDEAKPAPLDSVHLCDFPTANESLIDPQLSGSMRLLREIASLGRAARAEANLKVRQPLSRVEVVLADDTQIRWLKNHDSLVRDELNVKRVDYTTRGDQYVEYQIVPNFKRLGPRVGKRIQAVKATLADADGGAFLASLQATGKVRIEIAGEPLELSDEDIDIRLSARPGWAAAQGAGCVVVLATELTDELLREGIAKDLIRTIQNLRKEIGCQYTDRISVGIVARTPEVATAVRENQALIAGETLADEILELAIEGGGRSESDDAIVTVAPREGTAP